MDFLKIFKRKKIPDELPELATDEIEEKLEDKKLEKNKDIVDNYLRQEEEKVEPPKTPESSQTPEQKPQISQTSIERNSLTDKSFFHKLQTNLNEEITDLNKLEKWYNNKFLPRDVVSEMKGYWEKQKTDSIMQILGKNFQERISVQIERLENLEKEWQNIYFDLIEKEEEIKQHEGELKKMLAEFIEICKRKKEDIDND